MKRQDRFTEREGCETWEKIPKRPQRRSEAEDHFDAAHVYARDEGIDPDIAHNATREEVAAALARLGLLKNEQAVVLACQETLSGTRPSKAAIAHNAGLHRHTVAAILKRPKMREVLMRLQSGDLPRATAGVKRSRTLPGEMRSARYCLANYLTVDQWNDHTLCLYEPELAKAIQSTTPAERQVAMIRLCPRVLQHSEFGPPLLSGLVELLEATRFGSRSKAATARNTLRSLVHGSRGNPVGFSPFLLAQIVYGFQLSLAELQHDWRVIGDLRTMRERFPEDKLAEYGDTKLKQLLTGDLLKESAWLAEKATGMDSDTFLRAWRQSPYLQERLKERLLHDMKDGRFVDAKTLPASGKAPKAESH